MSEEPTGEAIVQRILGGQAPHPLRAAAARGALPLPRPALARLWVFLQSEDEDREIREEAARSLAGMETDALMDLLGDPDCAPEVLEHFAPQAARNEVLAERIAFHRGVPTGALAALAAAGNASVIELVLTNQERLLAEPSLLDHLSVNPALRADQRGRILELLDRAVRLYDRLQSGTEGAVSDSELEAAARLLEVDVGDLFTASEILDGEEFEQSDDVGLRTAYRRIIAMNTAQRAILAMRGGREERMILIRDSNKIVAVSVLKNPRMNDEDIESISRLRNVSDEVLRIIGTSREWLRSYSVVSALVNNPRTPQGVSSNLVARLQKQDLKRASNNHDVPELIRRMAKRILDQRTQESTAAPPGRKRR